MNDWLVAWGVSGESTPFRESRGRDGGRVGKWRGHREFGNSKRIPKNSTAQVEEFAPVKERDSQFRWRNWVIPDGGHVGSRE